jgi:hypothetical protein
MKHLTTYNDFLNENKKTGGDELTVAKLKEMDPKQIIASGTTTNSPEDIYMISSRLGDKLTWVAVRGGGYHDWTIYCDWVEKGDIDHVLKHGQKVFDPRNIQKLVPADEDAMKLYRF